MDQQAFGQMVSRYERLIYTICYQFTHNHHTAQDLAQDTFVSAWRHIDSFPEDNPKAWLARIATNKAKDYLKSAYNRRVQSEGENGLPEDKQVLFAAAQQPEDITIEQDQARRIERQIRALREPYHQVAVQYFLQQESVEEIARALKRPPKTVHTQLYRAKRMLQQELKGGAGHDTVP